MQNMYVLIMNVSDTNLETVKETMSARIYVWLEHSNFLVAEGDSAVNVHSEMIVNCHEACVDISSVCG